jgi:hypothetical protein
MLSRWEGLTDIYNRFHEQTDTDEDIVGLRELQVEMDEAVSSAYGWEDLNLEHGFHETKEGTRYTIGTQGRWDILDRLLALNFERYDEEVRKGLHGEEVKQKNRKHLKSKSENGGNKLFD